MEFLKIVLLSVAGACLYGIVHDLVTAQVCVEYFTVGHPPILGGTTNPLLLALGWGVIATWWVGLPLGVLLALCARAGRRRRLTAAELVRPVGALLLAMGAAALVAGVVGYLVARSGGVWLLEPVASRVPRERHALFLADLWAHLASYGSGILGGLVLCVLTLRRRARPVNTLSVPTAGGEPPRQSR